MKKLILSIFACLAAFNSFSQTIVEQHGALQTKGTQIVGKNGETVVLHGTSFGWHDAHPRFYNKGAVSYLAKNWGAQIVRASLGIDVKGGYMEKPEEALKCRDAVVKAAIKNGIYVIIDWHSHHMHTNEAVEFFRAAAKKYKGTPNVIYEIFNEPIDLEWDALKTYSEKVIKAIREIDDKALILVGTPRWSQNVDDAAKNPIRESDINPNSTSSALAKNVAYVLHFYAGTHKQELRAKGDFAMQHGLPLFVSECGGMNADGQGPIDQKSWNEWRSWMAKNNLSWACWSVSDKKETCSMLLPSALSNGNWKDSDLNDWGKFVKAELKKKD